MTRRLGIPELGKSQQRQERGIPMQGIVFAGDCGAHLATFPDPTPGPGEVILEIKASGMCGSDLHVYRRPRGTISPEVIRGHEPSGVVVAVGPGTVGALARVGARVMVHHYTGCASCPQCDSGWPHMCEEMPITVYGEDSHGAHAPFMKVRADTLVPLDERLSFAAGAAISCGVPTRPSGIFPRTVDLTFASAKAGADMSVSTQPGATQFT